MPGLIVRRPDHSPKARLANLRQTSRRQLRAKEKRLSFKRVRVVFRSMVVMTPHEPWVSDSELKARRARNLMEDNPTSG